MHVVLSVLPYGEKLYSLLTLCDIGSWDNGDVYAFMLYME